MHPIERVFEQARRLDLMATISLAFDESGKQDREHVVFAGFRALPSRWTEFSVAWNSRLRPYGLAYLHTSEAARLTGPYSQFKGHRKELVALMKSLAETVCRFAGEGIAVSISMEQYKKLDKKLQQEFKDPFYVAFVAGIRRIVESEGVEPGDVFNLICDDSEEYSSDCLSVYRRLRKMDPAIASKMGGICFVDDKLYAPLQAADLFAFCRRRHLEKPNAKDVWSELWAIFLTRFSEHDPGTLVFHTGDVL